MTVRLAPPIFRPVTKNPWSLSHTATATTWRRCAGVGTAPCPRRQDGLEGALGAFLGGRSVSHWDLRDLGGPETGPLVLLLSPGARIPAWCSFQGMGRPCWPLPRDLPCEPSMWTTVTRLLPKSQLPPGTPHPQGIHSMSF